MAGKKLLVADDSLTIQKVIRLALSNEGYEIHAVSDGNDAIQQISLFRPDLVLIDVSLPGKTAFEVKRAINEQGDFEELRFILMSSAFEKFDETQAKEVLFHGRLTKPFDPAHLRQVLTEVLDQVSAKRAEKTSLLQMPPIKPAASEPALPETQTEIEALPPMEPMELPPLPDSDIKELTESTIRMSGLDDFQWTVNEPLNPPPPPIEPELPPPPSFADTGGTHFESHLTPPPPPASSASAMAGPSPAQMEELLARQLEEAVQRMAKQMLPEIAERIIKQEIHRMLSEQP